MASNVKTLTIQREDGTEYDLAALHMDVIQFEPPSAAYTHNVVQVGRYGERHVGTVATQRLIPLKLDAFATNDLTVMMKRNQLFRIFDSMSAFYVIDKRLPTIRWHVRAEQQPFPLYDNWNMGGDITFNLVCIDGYAESVSTTLTPTELELSQWGLGMNLPLNKPLHYTFTTPEFDVYNASNIDIHAEERPYQILFQGSAGSLTITNATTNQTFQCDQAIGSSDQFVLYGAWPLLNGQSIYQNTNHGLIDLAQGWNHFKLGGCSGNFKIAFDTRFYY